MPSKKLRSGVSQLSHRLPRLELTDIRAIESCEAISMTLSSLFITGTLSSDASEDVAFAFDAVAFAFEDAAFAFDAVAFAFEDAAFAFDAVALVSDPEAVFSSSYTTPKSKSSKTNPFAANTGIAADKNIVVIAANGITIFLLFIIFFFSIESPFFTSAAMQMPDVSRKFHYLFLPVLGSRLSNLHHKFSDYIQIFLRHPQNKKVS